MRYFVLFSFLLFSFAAHAQMSGGQIQLDLTINDQPIVVGEKYVTNGVADSLYFETIRFYLSDIQFFQNEDSVYAIDKQHHLIDLENVTSTKINWQSNSNIQFNTIKFYLGVDSLTNVSGAFGGDLDPTNGMYWAWQSGYINFKLEGVTKDCPARKNRFQFHLGGYAAPFNALQLVTLPVDSSDLKNIKINLALDRFFKKINLKETYEVMSPNQKAVDLAQLVASIFSVSR